MNHPLAGIQYLIDGFRIISKPGLRRYTIIPFIINMGLFIGLFFILRHYLYEFNQWFVDFVPSWLHWLTALLWLLFFLVFFLLFIYAFVIVGNIISAPFNSLLAEAVEKYLTGKTSASRSVMDNIRDVPRILGRQLILIGYYLPRALLLFILFFIPILQAVAAILWFLFNAWFMALTYVDFPSDNQRIGIFEVKKRLKQKRLMVFMFGISVMVTAMIPILNFFTIPAAVAGATKFWIEQFSQSHERNPS